MSDTPKGLRCASKIRWAVFAGAVLLTVTTGFLVWIEITDGTPSSARSVVWGTALTLWVCGTLMSCALLVARLVIKRIDRATNKILDAIAMRKIGGLADIVGDRKVTQMYGRK